MISYGRDELEALVHAVGRHWGGQARDWRLVVEQIRSSHSPGVTLHVEIALGSFTRVTSIPLCKPDGGGNPRPATLAELQPDQAEAGNGAIVASVRRASVQWLLANSNDGNVEPLLGYLRCCGVLIVD